MSVDVEELANALDAWAMHSAGAEWKDDAHEAAALLRAQAAELAKLRSLVRDLECTCLPHAGQAEGVNLCPRCAALSTQEGEQ